MKRFALQLVIFNFLLTQCVADGRAPRNSNPTGSNPLVYSASLGPDQLAWVEDTLAGMTTRELVGQSIAAWIPGNYISSDSEEFDNALRFVEAGVGTFWMMGGLPHSRAAKLNSLQSKSKIPVLSLGVGLGGQLYGAPRDTWMLGGGTDLPPAMAFAAIGDPTMVQAAARIVGIEARATGSHIMDDGGGANILTNLDNVLQNRTYGDDPDLVSALSAAYVKGIHDAEALNYVGFFPGAGGLEADPHVRLPVAKNGRDTFEKIDFAPFRAAIEAGVDVVMTSHFAVPSLTGSDTLPATLSPEIIRLLRGLGFEGPVMTDDMSMGAIMNSYDNTTAAIEAFKAGHDILLGVREFELIDRLVELVEVGEISQDRLKESARRILELKAKLYLFRGVEVPLDVISSVVGKREHQRIADEAASRSITLLRDSKNLVPIAQPSETSVLHVILENEYNETAGESFHAALLPALKQVRRLRLTPSSGPEEYARLMELANNVDQVFLSVFLRQQLYEDKIPLPDMFVANVRQLQEKDRDIVFISFGKLTMFDQLPELGTVMLAWSGQPVMQSAAARSLLGETSISGRLPVALLPYHATGEGIDREVVEIETSDIIN